MSFFHVTRSSKNFVWKSSQRNEFKARITWSYSHLLLNHHSLIPNKSGVHSCGHKNALTTNYTHVSGDIFRRSILVVKGPPPLGVGGCLPDPAEISLFYRFFCGNKLSTHFTPYLHRKTWSGDTGSGRHPHPPSGGGVPYNQNGSSKDITWNMSVICC